MSDDLDQARSEAWAALDEALEEMARIIAEGREAGPRQDGGPLDFRGLSDDTRDDEQRERSEYYEASPRGSRSLHRIEQTFDQLREAVMDRADERIPEL